MQDVEIDPLAHDGGDLEAHVDAGLEAVQAGDDDLSEEGGVGVGWRKAGERGECEGGGRQEREGSVRVEEGRGQDGSDEEEC